MSNTTESYGSALGSLFGATFALFFAGMMYFGQGCSVPNNSQSYSSSGGSYSSSSSDIDKILAAKAKVRTMVNYPDTLDFHDLSTNVSGNTVTLKFTAKNAFGVPETHTMNIRVI